MRWILTAALLIATTTAQAQTPLTGTTGVPTSAPTPAIGEQTAPATGTSARTHHGRRSLQERFDAANTTHDGHLTAEQARAKMPAVARDFATIDTEHKGYVTVNDIRAHAAAKRAARRAAKEK